MGTTPNRQIPYVEPADHPNVYPAQDQAQAERLDALLFDTGWQPISIAAGFASDSTNIPQVRRVGSIVYTRGGWSNTGVALSAVNAVGTLPSGFRPTQGAYVAAGTAAGAAIGQFLINTGGSIQLRTGPTTTTAWHLITFFTV